MSTKTVIFQMFGIKCPDGKICPRIACTALGAWDRFANPCYGTDIESMVTEYEEEGYKCVKLDITESN